MIASIRRKWKRRQLPCVSGGDRWTIAGRQQLSEQQARVLKFILLCWLSGYLPSYSQIAEEMGMSHVTSVRDLLIIIERKGYIDIHHGQGYQLTDKALDLAL